MSIATIAFADDNEGHLAWFRLFTLNALSRIHAATLFDVVTATMPFFGATRAPIVLLVCDVCSGRRWQREVIDALHGRLRSARPPAFIVALVNSPRDETERGYLKSLQDAGVVVLPKDPEVVSAWLDEAFAGLRRWVVDD